jgi:uncharacterized protein (DUF1499 family)
MRSRIVRFLVVAAALLAVAVLAVRWSDLFAGTRPTALGIADDRLMPCPPTPNCVASQGDQADAEHYVAPIRFRADAQSAWTALLDAVRGSGRAEVVAERPGYLHAEFSSRVLGFVDDVEFQLDAGTRHIHVRSASRLGRGDFGVNRARIEAIRARLAAAEV